MGRSGITLEQVESAVSALEARNEAVTYDAIRNELGSGGYSTIGKHLQTLRARTASTSPMTVEVPAEIAASLTATLGQLWQQAQSVAAQDVETLRRAANARVQTAEQDLDQLLRRLDSTLEELEQTQSALAQSSTEVRVLEQAQARLQGENESLARQLNALQAVIQDQSETLKQFMAQHATQDEKSTARKRPSNDQA